MTDSGAAKRRKRLAVLAVARRHLALSETDYRAILLRYGGNEHASELDTRGFADVMDHFRTLGFVSTARQQTFGGERAGMASPGQIALIRQLWLQAVENPTDKSLDAFLSRQAHVSALRFLPVEKASGVITALRAMAARRIARTAAEPPDQPGSIPTGLLGLLRASYGAVCGRRVAISLANDQRAG